MAAPYVLVGTLPFFLGLLLASVYCLLRRDTSESVLTYQMVAGAFVPAVAIAVHLLFARWQFGVPLTAAYAAQIAALLIWGPDFARFLIHVRHMLP